MTAAKAFPMKTCSPAEDKAIAEILAYLRENGLVLHVPKRGAAFTTRKRPRTER